MKRLFFAASILGVALLAAQSEIMTFSPAVSPTPGGYTVVAGEIPNVDGSHLPRKTVIRLDTKTGRASYADTVNLGDETVLMWRNIHDRDSLIEYINNKAEHNALLKQTAKPPGM
jgi:hypothetical protein